MVRSTQLSFASIQCKASQLLFFTGLTSALFNLIRQAVKDIFIYRPTNLTARHQTYSNNKSHNTVKYLVGMSPAGANTFMSSGWGGRVSDKQITVRILWPSRSKWWDTSRSWFYHQRCGATLRMPHFTRGKKQRSAQEVETSRRLSNVRIHIERIIFRILTTVVPFPQVDLRMMILELCVQHSKHFQMYSP